MPTSAQRRAPTRSKRRCSRKGSLRTARDVERNPNFRAVGHHGFGVNAEWIGIPLVTQIEEASVVARGDHHRTTWPRRQIVDDRFEHRRAIVRAKRRTETEIDHSRQSHLTGAIEDELDAREDASVAGGSSLACG